MVEAGWSRTAAPANTASATKTRVGAHQLRRARCPAYAKSPAVRTRMTVTRNGLSRCPSSWIARSATGPGVSRMTSSATDTTGDSRIAIAIATK